MSVAPGNSLAKSNRNGMLPPWPMSMDGVPHAVDSASLKARWARPPVAAANGSPIQSASTVTSAPHGAWLSRCRTSASRATLADAPGGTRRLTRARAVGQSVLDASATGVASSPMIEREGCRHSRDVRDPLPISCTEGRAPISRRRSSSVRSSGSASPEMRPATATLPPSS